MAVLTDADYAWLRRELYRAGSIGKTQLQALPGLPSKSELRAAFQALEDRYTADRLNYKAALDAALGITTTPALAKEFERVWHRRWAER